MSPTRIELCHALAATLLLSAGADAVLAAEGSVAIQCDLLGREIALRAAEQMETAITTANRATLAEIARQACLDYQVQPVMADAAPGTISPAAQETTPTAAPEAEESDAAGLFDLEIIEPEDRVRRPGLKRR
jgi:hypothetical protein